MSGTTSRRSKAARSRAPAHKTAPRAVAPAADDAALVEGLLVALKRTVPEAKLEAAAKALVRVDARLTAQVERMPGTRWFLVRMRKGATPADAFAAARLLQRARAVRLAEPALLSPGITLDDTAYPALAAELGVTRVKPARRARAFSLGLDPTVDCQWSLKLARVLDDNGAPGAWSVSPSRGAGVVVGHPDTGYTTHAELWCQRLRWREGWNYVEDNGDPLDPLTSGLLKFPGHGTGTSSVIMSDAGDPPAGELPVEQEAIDSGRARRRTGFVSGTAPEARLVPLRVAESVVHFSFAKLAKALCFATVRGHHVVSMSLGGPVESDALREAIDAAVKKGLILIAAAGNYWPWVVYPAANPKVLCLGACNAASAMWQHSATGPRVDVSAPGEDVWAARVRRAAGGIASEVSPSSGTSHATATTAGIAALWLAHHGVERLRRSFGADLAGVFRVLVQQSARRPAGWNTARWGAGIIDAHALVRAPIDDVESLTRRARRPHALAARPRWAFADVFPELSPTQLEAGVAALARSPRGRERLARDRLLARELAWLLLHDAAARASMRVAATGAKRSRARAQAAAGLPPSSKARVSPALQQVLR